LEANPNPEIAWGEEYASAAEAAGTEYEELLQRIISLGIRRRTGR
jgi:D-alanine-D-alanine ligase